MGAGADTGSRGRRRHGLRVRRERRLSQRGGAVATVRMRDGVSAGVRGRPLPSTGAGPRRAVRKEFVRPCRHLSARGRQVVLRGRQGGNGFGGCRRLRLARARRVRRCLNGAAAVPERCRLRARSVPLWCWFVAVFGAGVMPGISRFIVQLSAGGSGQSWHRGGNVPPGVLAGGCMARAYRRPWFWPLVLWVCGLYLTLAGLSGEAPFLVAPLGAGLVWVAVAWRRG